MSAPKYISAQRSLCSKNIKCYYKMKKKMAVENGKESISLAICDTFICLIFNIFLNLLFLSSWVYCTKKLFGVCECEYVHNRPCLKVVQEQIQSMYFSAFQVMLFITVVGR